MAGLRNQGPAATASEMLRNTVAQQGSNQRQFRVSASVAPRSTKTPNGDFSPSSALSGAPIKIQVCTGDVEIEDTLLQKQNPAELTIHSRYLGSITYTTLAARRNVLYTVEEETWYSDGWQHSAKSAPVSAHAERLKQYPNYSHSLRRKNSRAQYGPELSSNILNHSLTCTYLNSSTMSILHSVPGTPPELIDSHSTTDSSVTSNVSATDDFSASSMNFEDINLQDENHKTEEIHRKGSRNAFVPYKKPSTTRRPVLATIQTQQTSRTPSDRTIKSAALPSSKRNFTSPTSAPGSTQKSSRTHSESPSLHKSRSVSRLGQFTQSPSSSLNVPGRRGSWQPARKTIYEIEAEYHDSDDELPDDASLFNVPMSPFVGGRTASLSARSSARGSPERDSPAMSPAPIPLSHSRTAPERPPNDRTKSRTLPRQRLTPRSSSNQLLKLSKSASPSPQGDLRYGRTRSWNLVMADLDHEARVIAEKLDFHHEAQAKSDLMAVNPHRSSAPGAIPLPPIQRGTLDFMPMSKEKEAVLSRTRPSWLPPKDPREEQRHLEEYKKMMKASLEADKRRQVKMREQHCTTDATRDSLHRIWTYYVDPTTDIAAIDNRVDGLCWRGIPPKLRGAVWQRKVGNPLGLTIQDYRMALLKVKEIKSRPAERRSKQDIKMHKYFADIEKDAETAFPDISIFQRNGPQWQDLVDVCEAYAVCCSDLGYSYGIQLVAAMILLQIPNPSDALIFMANCLKKPLAAAFLSGETATKTRTYGKVRSTLEIKFPRLHAYLFSTEEDGGLNFTGEELFEPMFHTIFANGLDLDRLCRVWDVWIFESDRYLTRTAVALLGSLQSQIFDIEGDIHLRKRNIQELLGWGPFERVNGGYWNLALSGNGDTFVESIRKAGKLDCVGE